MESRADARWERAPSGRGMIYRPSAWQVEAVIVTPMTGLFAFGIDVLVRTGTERRRRNRISCFAVRP